MINLIDSPELISFIRVTKMCGSQNWGSQRGSLCAQLSNPGYSNGWNWRDNYSVRQGQICRPIHIQLHNTIGQWAAWPTTKVSHFSLFCETNITIESSHFECFMNHTSLNAHNCTWILHRCEAFVGNMVMYHAAPHGKVSHSDKLSMLRSLQ